MTSEFGEFDARDIEVEDRRLSIGGTAEDLSEGLLDYTYGEVWESLDTEIFVAGPECGLGGWEFRPFDDHVWLGRRGDEFEVWYDPPGLVSRDESEANKAIWESLDTEIFAVVRDWRGFREEPDPELVRRSLGDRFLSLWRGVCEVLPDRVYDNLELIPVAEWASRSPETRYTQVQERIAARLRARGLEPIIPEIDGTEIDIETGMTWDELSRSLTRQGVTWGELWNSLRSPVYVWVESCQMACPSQVRHWGGDRWLWRDFEGRHKTIRTSKLRDWGCLVRTEDWERVYPESVQQWNSVDAHVSPRELGRRRRFDHFGSMELDWRKAGF
jgi:hypothetical protein